ncbi:MAG: antitoxin family protein [Desulfobacteraceae bacterium]|nr:antitoxin family protein [Desulfobacteraceae bacterium]
MSEDIIAVYENGCLRPLHPLYLNENETVRIMILPKKQTDDTDEVIEMMTAAGLIKPSRVIKVPLSPDPVTEQERSELAEKLGKIPGRTLSEIIISEREQ